MGVVDGDTINVSIDNHLYPLYYIGIYSPEISSNDPFSAEASQKNSELVSGKTITLVKDVIDVDKYGRLLRYVFVSDVFVNYEMVRQGFATTMTFPPDIVCADTFKEAMQQARLENLGMWAPTFIPSLTPVFRFEPPPATVELQIL